MLHKLALLISAVMIVAVCEAQVEQGAITGVVVDPSGASVPKAKVTATNQATQAVAVAETTDDGYYKIPYLLAGKYDVVVEMTGFALGRVTGVPVLVGQIATIDVTLKPGTVHDEVTVSSNAVLIEQASSSLGYVTGVTQILELPINRSAYALEVLAPGVINTGNTGTGPIVNGGRSNTSAILLDGQDTRNNSTLDNAYTPPMETVQEVRFITNSFSAEYGRSAGGVLTAAGKTGTNQVHGSAYEFLKNDKLNANGWNNNRNGVARGPVRHDEFGFSVSGPVYLPKVYNGHNKTFFFFNWEKVVDHAPRIITNDNVPTDQQKLGDFSQTKTSTGALIQIYDPLTTVADPTKNSGYGRSPFPGNLIPANRIDPIAKKLLTFYPEPSLPGVINNYSNTVPAIADNTRYFTRGDQNFGQKNRLFFRFGYQLSPQNSPYTNVAFPGEGTNGGGNQRTVSYVYGLSDTETFSPTLIGEFRLGYTRSKIQLTPLSAGFDISTIGLPQYLKSAAADALFPLVEVTDMTALGPARASHDIDAENTPEPQAHLTWLRGAHAIKTGYDMLFCQFNTFRPDYPSGDFQFSRSYTQGPDPAVASATSGYGLATMLLGAPTGGAFTIGPSLALLQTSYNWYLQDDWKVSRNLTLNLGVRWEYQAPWKERYNHLSYFDPNATDPITGLKGLLTPTTSSHPYPSDTNKNNWAPRVGLAWTFLPNTVFRAGYGIFFAPGSGGIGSSPGDLGSGSETSTPVYFGQVPAAPNTPVVGASLANPFVTGLLPFPNSLIGNGINAIFPHWVTPENQMWNANIQRIVAKNLLVEAAYVGSRGEHIWNNFTSNATFPQYLSLGTQLNSLVPNPFFGKISTGSLSAATVRQGSLLVPYPQYTGVGQLRGSVGDSVYHGFTLRAERSFSDGLLFQSSFTAAKLIDDVNERFVGGTNYINPYNLKQSRSISAADISQRWVSNFVYELPFGHGKRFLSRGIGSWILGNWQTAGIYTMQTGTPISIGAACNLPGVSGLGCYANRLKDGNLPSGKQNINQWFDTTAFTNPAQYTFGNDSRTEPDLRNPGLITFDSVLSRWQPIREGMRLQFRAEMYDILNHPNLGTPSTSITSTNFGQITSKSTNRTITMALRLQF
jgi:hypothetical protein